MTNCIIKVEHINTFQRIDILINTARIIKRTLSLSDANTPGKEKDQSLEVQEVRVEGQEVLVEGQEAPHQGIEQINFHLELMIKRNRAGRVHPCPLSGKK